ncbi:MAG TPA: helix-turn-helix domain-containing protein [Candidatus Binataceae bacterium]|nr:helix-turn-helix domain-containing protein [Candidatus Binataceae bacterium]
MNEANRRGQTRHGGRSGELPALRSVLIATGGQAKLLELYKVLSAEEAAEFLGIALQTVRNMTARRELPCIRTGKRGVGYRVIDLIQWQEDRAVATRG